jgi:hypothetical protein
MVEAESWEIQAQDAGDGFVARGFEHLQGLNREGHSAVECFAGGFIIDFIESFDDLFQGVDGLATLDEVHNALLERGLPGDKIEPFISVAAAGCGWIKGTNRVAKVDGDGRKTMCGWDVLSQHFETLSYLGSKNKKTPDFPGFSKN